MTKMIECYRLWCNLRKCWNRTEHCITRIGTHFHLFEQAAKQLIEVCAKLFSAGYIYFSNSNKFTIFIFMPLTKIIDVGTIDNEHVHGSASEKTEQWLPENCTLG